MVLVHIIQASHLAVADTEVICKYLQTLRVQDYFVNR